MIKNNMHLFATFKKLIIAGLISITIVAVDSVNAENDKPKGKNIILEKSSSKYAPSYRNEFRALDEQLEQATTDEEIRKLEKEYEKIAKKVQKWFADKDDPEKEKKVREKQKLLGETLSKEGYDENTMLQLRKSFPFTSIGYDSIHNSLEVGLEPDKFNKEIIDKSIKKIRSIVGDDIDLTISPIGPAIKNLCTNRTTPCVPLEAGMKIRIPIGSGSKFIGCTSGFKANFNGDDGIVVAGHCIDGAIGSDIKQGGTVIGTAEIEFDSNGTDCDCGFIKINDPPSVVGKIFGLLDPDQTGEIKKNEPAHMSGGYSSVETGLITDVNAWRYFIGGGLVKDLVVADYFSQPGDSGSTVSFSRKLLGIHMGSRSDGSQSYFHDTEDYEIKFGTHGNFLWGF